MGNVITLPETATVDVEEKERTPSLVGDVAFLGIKASRFLVGYTFELARGVAPVVARNALTRFGVVESPQPTPEQEYRSRLELFEQTMRERIPFYEDEYHERQAMGEEPYKAEVKLGVRTSLLQTDAMKWIEYARAEQNPGPTAGPNLPGHVSNVAACLASWELDNEAINRLIDDLNDHYQLVDSRMPQAEPEQISGHVF